MSAPRILVVDDEIIIAREVEARLNSMGYVVPGIASSGEEAVRLAAEYKPDLILMDIVIKGDMDGIEAAEAIRREFHVPVIYVTAYTDEKTLERARLTEPFAYLVKPFSERELKANIEMALYKHRMEARLRKVERWLTEAVDEMTHAVIAADCEGRVTFFNQGAEAITAWKREEALGRSVHEVFRLISRSSGVPVELQTAAEGPLVYFSEDTALLDRSETAVPVENTTTVLRDNDDRPVGTVSVFRDPTGTRYGSIAALNADISLAVSQSLTLQGMLQMCAESVAQRLHAPFARVWTLDTKGTTLVLQASAGLYTHLDREHSMIPVGESAIGRIASRQEPHLTNDVLNDPDMSDREWARREGMVAFAGYPLVVDERLLGVMAVFSRTELPVSTLAALETIAHNLSVGVERKRLEEQLRQSQKGEALGQLAAGVAHDFNNLLTIVASCSDMLLTSECVNPEDKALIREIEQAGTRAASLTRQLLAFSRKQVVEPTVLRLNDVVGNIERMLHRLIGEDIALSTQLDPKLKPIIADVGQIEQVVLNLALNSRDAMEMGGQLTIETGNVVLDRDYTQARPELATGNYVMIAVSDTGCGMSPEVLDRVFEPYFTTKEPGKGTGLGLATVFGIVKQWGGHISAYSERGVGTTFKVYFPEGTGEQTASAAESQGLDLPRGDETILVVEDDEAVRSLTCRVLRMCGYTVLEAGSGMMALGVTQKHKGPIDLLLTDVVMPNMGGRSLAKRIAKARPACQVLYVSGYTDDTVVRHGILRAHSSFLQKPFTPRALAEKVRALLDNRSPDPGRN